ncbi:F-box only protein 22-like [Mercenaria mercenaria]|uniref:F-box only protein 22-like n=1 Tax=Mercenaria mercenaria TaxID=6596 RepID=UPI00234E8BD4|nr:F-box only protein 22-like [Mercenaria mercenaria]
MASGDHKESSDDFHAFFHHLTNTMHLTENILKYLNAMELNRCSRVCAFWAKIVKKLKSKRKTRSWTCFSLSAGDEDFTSITQGTQQFLQEQYTEPDVVFMICESDLLLEKITIPALTRSGRACRGTQSYQDFVRSLLPQSCSLFGIESGGVVGTTTNCRQSIEAENDSRGVSFLCLPKYDGVDIKISDDISENDSDAKLQQYINSLSEPGNPDFKVILNLIADFQTPRKYGFDLMKAVPGALVAGAYVEGVFTRNCDSYPLIQLAAIGGDRVQIASAIINETIDDAAGAEECIKKLKSHSLPEENSFAFMFACLGRGEGLYDEPNVESSIFRRYFPSTPLIGLFGNGEIGFELVNKGSYAQNDEKQKSSKTLYHSYTTVLVLVSIT